MARGGDRKWEACAGSNEEPRRITHIGDSYRAKGECTVCGKVVTLARGANGALKTMRHKAKK